MKVKVYNQAGEALAETELSPGIFEMKNIKPEVVHQVVTALQANSRKPLASTKDRSEVRGGGKKPWRQKGTGRARAGSIRSPLWVGGGVTFGPTPARNFAKKLNSKTKILGLRMALSNKAAGKKVYVIDKLELAEAKTKNLRGILDKFIAKFSGLGRNILIISDKRDEKLIRSARNLPEVKVTNSGNLNIIDVLAAGVIFIYKDALPVIEKKYSRNDH